MRRGFDWSGRFPWIGDVLRSLQSATIDGEAVWCWPDGISDFENVMQNLERDRCPVSREPIALLGAEIELLASLDLSADNTAEKQQGRPFDPGQSGNP